MKYRLQTQEDKEIYAQCKSTIELVLGVIEYIMGFRQFMPRGFEKAKDE